jgi:hypothetical protein
MKFVLSVVSLIVGMLGINNHAFAWGSLAIDTNQGTAYGFSFNHLTAQEADARALKECGYGCRVVKNFATGCGAYAADQSKGSIAFGWGVAATEKEAKNTALSYCRRYGGTKCIIRVWSCNSN